MNFNIFTNFSFIKSNTFRIVFPVLVVLSCLFVFMAFDMRSKALLESNRLALAVSKEISNSIETYFIEALTITRTYSANFINYKKNKIPRHSVYDMMKNTIAVDNKFLAIWTIWEANAYDSMDLFYANDSMHDCKGFFASAYYYDDGIIKHEVNDTADFYEDFYTLPKKIKGNLITDPFHYQYHGNKKIFYETSIVSPVIENDRFLGVIGIDIDLNQLQKKFSNIRVYQNGFISILSNSGLIVTHPQLKYINATISKYLRKENQADLDSFYAEASFHYSSVSEFSGQACVRFYYPIKINYMAAPWYIETVARQNSIKIYHI